MKDYRLLYLLLVMTMVSCAHREPEYVDFTHHPYTNGGNVFIPVSEETTDIRSVSPWQPLVEAAEAEDQMLAMSDSVTAESEQAADSSAASAHAPERHKASPLAMTDVFRGLLESMLTYKVHQVAGVYKSVDVHGDSVLISGKFFYPENGVIKKLMIVSHYTIGANAEAPSQTYAFEGMYAGFGYGVIMADYIGYGITRDQVHPYLQAETTARNVIDMALAVRPFVTERGLKLESDSVILLGYSQGGATTLHVQRLMETYPEYMDEFKIKKNYAGAGPYDIAKTYDYSVKKDYTGIPCAVPLIIQGMSVGMSTPLDMAYFFKEPLLSNYNEWLNSKKYTVSQMSSLIGVNKLSEILTPNGVDRTKRETARFYEELIENSIPSYYRPKAPLFMFHSEDDDVVPFVNSQLMQRQFRSSLYDGELYTPDITYDFGHYGSHMKGAIKFLMTVAKDLD